MHRRTNFKFETWRHCLFPYLDLHAYILLFFGFPHTDQIDEVFKQFCCQNLRPMNNFYCAFKGDRGEGRLDLFALCNTLPHSICGIEQ
jgi:hypothetical protein